MFDCLIVINAGKGCLGEEHELGRRESESQEVIEEEVVKLVWTYKVFRFLFDVSVLVGRDKFWRDWRIDNVLKRCL